jgi:hypothetical protein
MLLIQISWVIKLVKVQLSANLSNFMGQNAGYQADAYQSNFFGQSF